MLSKVIEKKTILEATVLDTTKTKPIVDAIKNRKKISFMYYGPQKPKKDSVKPGKRIKVEPVAIGLSKKGNLIVRAWVDIPSVSKKGFTKTHWRTFLVGRMRSIEITDEIFTNKRPDYKEGEDRTMSVTYVTSDWTNKPEPITKTKPTPKPISTEPVKPEKKELPQPKIKEKPPLNPQEIIKNYDFDVYDNLKQKIKDSEDKKVLNKQDFDSSVKELYKLKEKDWIENQKKIGGNTSIGQGTRNRFMKDSELELNNLLKKDNVTIVNNQLQESLKRIKTLMLY